MTAFPTLTPSSRTFTPGEYPHSVFTGISGIQGRVRNSNVMLSSQVRLTFAAITEAQMLLILTHYQGQQGTFQSFPLPSAIWSGVSDATDYQLTGYGWRYIEPPSVSDAMCANAYDVELTLETVPPEGTAIAGLDFLVISSLMAGEAAAANGMTTSVAVSLTAGLPNVQFDFTVTASLAAGDATADAAVSGLDESVTWTLDQTETDPDFANVSLLLHMDGSNGGTTFTDSSSNAHSITAFGNAQTSTAQFKYGTASALFDGSGDYLTTPYSTSLYDWWASDYTIEAWVYATSWANWSRTSAGTIPCMVGNVSPTGITAYWSFGPDSTGKLKLYYFNGSEQHAMITTATLATSQWNHIAAVKTSSGVTLYTNGTSSGGAFSISGTPQSSSAVTFTIGAYNNTAITGYVDDLRVTKGVARYTANFTPPTAPFPDS